MCSALEIKPAETELIEKQQNIDFNNSVKKRKEFSISAYELAFLIYNCLDAKNIIYDLTIYVSLNFNLIIILTFIMFIACLKDKLKQVIIINIINIISLFISTFLLYLSGIITEINQIKYGFYLFLLNYIFIILECINKIKITK